MRIPKRYGESRVDNCPFCGKIAVVKNKQGIPVCSSHKSEELKDMKCICGSWLELRKGKYGPYFFCIKCGNISFRKAIGANTASKGTQTKRVSSYAPKEITITSDQLDYM